MVIQCTSCQTKYRLNLERIPNRKTFVKCRSCGTPIYIEPPPEAEGASAASVAATASEPPAPFAESASSAPPTGDGAFAEPAAEPPVIACPNCDTRYRLPAEALARPNAKMKCTRCGHVFAPGMGAAAAPTRHVTPEAREFYSSTSQNERSPGAGLERPMPIPDDTAVDGMFDDFRERATPFAAGSARAGGMAKAPPRESPPEPPEPDFSGLDETPEEGGFGDSVDSEFERQMRKDMGVDLSAQLGFRGAAADEMDAEQDALSDEPEPMPEPEGMAELDGMTESDLPESEPSATLFTTDLEQLGEQAAEAASRSLHPTREADPERAYLEAVAMDQDLPQRPKARGTVPPEQKYRFFLKPGIEPPPIKAPPGPPRAAAARGGAPARPPQIIAPEPPSPAARTAGPPPPLDRFPAELEEMDTAFEPAMESGEEELFTPPPGAPTASFEAELDSADLDVMAGALEEDAELSEGLDVTDDVDLLLQQHGVAADAMDGDEVSIVRTDPLASVGDTLGDETFDNGAFESDTFGEAPPSPKAPARPAAGRAASTGQPFGRAPLSESLLRSLGRSIDMATGEGVARAPWLGHAMNAGLIAAAVAVVVLAFWLGYRLG